MPAERAGLTVTVFLVDISPSMGALRKVELPGAQDGETRIIELTKLQWSLQFVKTKIQEMIFNGRKTDKCGVITFGSDDTDNIVNRNDGGYEHVSEYIPIAQPNASTLAKIDELRASETAGDPMDGLIVGIETQDVHLQRKRTWTRKIVLVTDGESPVQVEDWEKIAEKMGDLNVLLTVVGVDFDDKEIGYREENKSPIKRENEAFYSRLIGKLPEDYGLLGSLEHALLTLTYPQIRETKSALLATKLRLGDVAVRVNEAIELNVAVAKYTSQARAAPWKKFLKKSHEDEDEMADDEADEKDIFREVKRCTEYVIDRSPQVEEGEPATGDVSMDVDGDESSTPEESHLERVEKEQLVKGFKYGSTYVPCPEGQFERLSTKKGIDICGFFYKENLNRSYAMGEVSYVFAARDSPADQLGFSSIVQAMEDKGVLAIARMVTRDGIDPKMGVLSPTVWSKVDVLLWVQMPFADDVRHYTFPSLLTLVSRSGKTLTTHPYIPTEEQLKSMDDFVEAMDLTNADEDEDGSPRPWFDPQLSYNPAVHRAKQAQFHCAVVSDLNAYPLPPPHPELTKYFNPPRRVLKKAKHALQECKDVFKVKEVPKKVVRARKDGHVRAQDQDEDMILLDQMGPAKKRSGVDSPPKSQTAAASSSPTGKKKAPAEDDSETESESEGELLLDSKSKPRAPGLPTPTASPEPEIDPSRASGRIIGNAYPLKDFRENLKQGDVVTKAVEDLGVVVREIVGRPFSSRRQDEMVTCLKELRETCLREDEIDAWNRIIQGLKQDCMSANGNKDFWTRVQTLGRSMSLISETEAKQFGGITDVSDSAAESFIQQ